MKIAHVITRLIIGGAQENTVLNCEDLARDHGDEVLLVTGPTEGPEGSLMRRVQDWEKPVEDGDGAGQGGLSWKIVPTLIRPLRPAADLRAYFALKRIFREFRPEVVHTHSAKAGILGRLAARACGVPVIVHGVHGAPFWPDQNPVVHAFYRWCERFAAKRCDHFVCVADAMTELMVDAGVAPREKFTTVYSGMEVGPFLESAKDRAMMRAKLGFRDEDIVVGKIARLFELKGHEYVIEAAPEILRENPRVRFLFVGDGLLSGRFQDAVRRLGLEERFTFAGLVQPTEIPAYLAATDLVVHTSLREGLARVLPQALLAGKPVVSYDVDGAREVVRDGETGFLLPPKTVDGLAEAVLKLAGDAELRARFAQAGRDWCRERFDHHRMTDQIREIYTRGR